MSGVTAVPLSGQSWRDLIKVHPAADKFEMMSEEELVALAEDIGRDDSIDLMVPPVFWTPLRAGDFPGPRSKERYNAEVYLLDGRNRLEAIWRLLDPALPQNSDVADNDREQHIRDFLHAAIDGHSKTGVLLYGDADPWEFAISANVHRRHLDRDQKRNLVAALLKERPDRSNNSTAKLANVSDKTVGAVRQEMEQRSEIPNVSTRTDAAGRQQPARRPPPAAVVHRSSLPPPSKEPHIPQLREQQVQRAAEPAPAMQAKPFDVVATCFDGLFQRLDEYDGLRDVPFDRLALVVLAVMARLGVTIELLEEVAAER